MRELDAHKKLERILVLVPARLATKWKKELDTKFDEQFEKVKGRDLLDRQERLHLVKNLNRFVGSFHTKAFVWTK